VERENSEFQTITKKIIVTNMKTYKFKINGNEYSVDINSVEGNIADVTVNGASYKVEMDNAPVAPAAPAAAPTTVTPTAAPAPVAQAAPAAASGEGKPVQAPMPGVILEVSVKVGDKVKAGQKVAVLEAMKMENEIDAPADGTVTAVLVSKGDSVNVDQDIVKIA
jgi:biotin carboxyl carrier protein